LLPALQNYRIPEDDWNAVADAFIDKLAGISLNLNLQNFHAVDTRRTLTRADAHSTSVSNDWENEIHPTADGYEKLAPHIVSRICTVLGISATAMTPALAAAVPSIVAPATVSAALKRGRRSAPGSAHA
jgi:hypothetical protein